MYNKIASLSLILALSAGTAHAVDNKAACEKSGGVWLERPGMTPPGFCQPKIKGESGSELEPLPEEEVPPPQDGNGVKFKAGSEMKSSPPQMDGGTVTATTIINDDGHLQTSAPANDFNSSRSNKGQVISSSKMTSPDGSLGHGNALGAKRLTFGHALKVCRTMADVDLQKCIDTKTGQRDLQASDHNSTRSNKMVN